MLKWCAYKTPSCKSGHIYIYYLPLVYRYDQSIDLALREWVLQRMSKGEVITHDELKRKALEMILPCNPGFQASYGWFIRFLTRHNLTLNRASQRKRKSIRF